MRNATRWAKTITASAVEFAALYAWKIHGIEQAGNLLTFLVWVVFALSLVIFATPKSYYPATRPAHSHGIKTFSLTADTLFIAGLAWFGHFALATASLFAVVATWSFLGSYDAAGNLKTKGTSLA